MEVKSKISQQNNDLGHVPSSDHAGTSANDGGTNAKIDTPVTRDRSVSVPTFIVFSPHGNPIGPFASSQLAAAFAEKKWPGKDCDVQNLWAPDEILTASLIR